MSLYESATEWEPQQAEQLLRAVLPAYLPAQHVDAVVKRYADTLDTLSKAWKKDSDARRARLRPTEGGKTQIGRAHV